MGQGFIARWNSTFSSAAMITDPLMLLAYVLTQSNTPYGGHHHILPLPIMCLMVKAL